MSRLGVLFILYRKSKDRSEQKGSAIVVCIVAENGIFVFVQEDPLAEYKEELEVLNERLGRAYGLYPTGDDIYEDNRIIFCIAKIDAWRL